jgi:diamine N-acetyltransferase
VLHLEEITAGNLDDAIGVTVRPDQDHLVAPVVKSLAEAYVHPTVAWPRLIRDGGLPVGFLMGFFDADFAEGKGDPDLRSGLWRLNVAVGAQGRGVGRFAVDSVAAEVRRRGGDRLTTTWHPGPDGPEGFYRALGFRTTGELSGGQVVGELRLT